MKKLFLCGAALIFMTTAAIAFDECKTPAIVTQMLTEANQGMQYSTIVLENETVVKGFLGVVMAQFGPPPGVEPTDIKKILIYKPEDLKQYNYYVAFYDVKDCKLIGVFVPESLMNQLVKEAGVESGQGT